MSFKEFSSAQRPLNNEKAGEAPKLAPVPDQPQPEIVKPAKDAVAPDAVAPDKK